MNVIKGNFANGLTCLNLVSGIIAIICGSTGGGLLWGLSGTHWAWVFIGIAAVADFSDGFAARLLNAYSELGKELDSLCDNVSFGVAPALTLFFALEDYGADGWVKWFALVIAVCGALRLARFNTDSSQRNSFVGLPIPGNAIFWIGYMAQVESGSEWMTEWWIVVPLILLESWLMVSNLRIFSFKMHKLSWGGNEARWLTIAASVVLLVVTGLPGLFWSVVFYVVLSQMPVGRRISGADIK